MKQLTRAGHWLRDWRDAHNLSLDKLARQVGVSRASISQMSRGSQKWSATVTLALFALMTPDERAQFEHLMLEDMKQRIGTNAKV